MELPSILYCKCGLKIVLWMSAWCSGYHISFTRRRSPVQSRQLIHFFPNFSHSVLCSHIVDALLHQQHSCYPMDTQMYLAIDKNTHHFWRAFHQITVLLEEWRVCTEVLWVTIISLIEIYVLCHAPERLSSAYTHMCSRCLHFDSQTRHHSVCGIVLPFVAIVLFVGVDVFWT